MLFECKYMKISLVDKAHLKSGQILFGNGATVQRCCRVHVTYSSLLYMQHCRYLRALALKDSQKTPNG